MDGPTLITDCRGEKVDVKVEYYVNLRQKAMMCVSLHPQMCFKLGILQTR